MEINSNPVANEIELFLWIPLNKISDFFQPWRKESLNNNGHSASSPFHPLTLPSVMRSTLMASVKKPYWPLFYCWKFYTSNVICMTLE